MRHGLLIALIGLMSICSNTKTIYDISIFDNTRVSDLARFAANEDTLNIKKYIAENPKIDIDCPDPFLGVSLLMWSIYNDKYNSFIELLKHGADPNFISKNSGETPLIYATNFISERGYDNRYIIELLKNGADANMLSIEISEGDTIYRSPIPGAVWYLEYIRPLVEIGGVDVNFSLYGISIVQDAIVLEKIDVLYYLVVEHDADITGQMVDPFEIPGEAWPSILLIDNVKRWEFPENSKELHMKNEIIKKYNEQIAR